MVASLGTETHFNELYGKYSVNILDRGNDSAQNGANGPTRRNYG